MSKGIPRIMKNVDQEFIPVKKIRRILDVPITVSATGAAAGWGTVALENLPEGYIKMVGAACHFDFDGTGDNNVIAAWNGDFSIGSDPSTDNSALAGSQADIIGSSATKVAAARKSSDNVFYNAVDALIDNTANDKEFNINMLIDAASIGDDESATLKIQGIFEFTFLKLLDD